MEKPKITRKDAILEIQLADDPTEYDKAIDYALYALQTDVPRERIDALVTAIDKLPKLLIQDTRDDKVDVFCSMSRVFALIDFYTDRKKGGENEPN